MTTPPPAPLGTLVESERKNQLSVAFLSMVAARAGFVVLEWKADYDGVDVTLRSSVDYGHRYGADLDLQLKCTSSRSRQHPETVSYPLDRAVYEKLSHPKRFALGALAVLVVPEDINIWLDQTEERLLTKACMYFSPATEWDPISSDAASKTVHCRRSDLLTVDALATLLHSSSRMGLATA